MPDLAHNYNFELLSDVVVLISISKDTYNEYMHLITRLFFYSTDDIFISLTKNNDEISLIVTECYFIKHMHDVKFNQDLLHNQKYYVFKMLEYSSQINKIGIVKNQSKIMADSGISILYITTYNYDYILVEADQKDMTLECLQTNGYTYIK